MTVFVKMAMRSLCYPAKFGRRYILKYSSNKSTCGVIPGLPKDEITHTGQIFDKDDYRLVRFVDKTKHVNPNWGIKLIAEIPPAQCPSRVVWCDGGGGPTGHPKVYINLDKPGTHSCNYCGLKFEQKKDS